MPKGTKKLAVADSWEDEDLSDNAPEDPTPSQPSTSTPSPPQPASTTIISDTTYSHNWETRSSEPPPPSTTTTSLDDALSAKRPEKTDAVARRMIAAGLGLRAPKQTEEQKAYQASIKEQEKRRREKEREEEKRQHERTEKAKAAIWDD